jgi:hypothetical protein
VRAVSTVVKDLDRQIEALERIGGPACRLAATAIVVRGYR